MNSLIEGFKKAYAGLFGTIIQLKFWCQLLFLSAQCISGLASSPTYEVWLRLGESILVTQSISLNPLEKWRGKRPHQAKVLAEIMVRGIYRTAPRRTLPYTLSRKRYMTHLISCICLKTCLLSCNEKSFSSKAGNRACRLVRQRKIRDWRSILVRQKEFNRKVEEKLREKHRQPGLLGKLGIEIGKGKQKQTSTVENAVEAQENEEFTTVGQPNK